MPLVTVLFMASVMLPLFLPQGMSFDKFLRALIGVALFASAYMAEMIRGGLQAIPKGQYEGADSLGLSYWQKTGLIVLPQALKLVIPGIVNTFIGHVQGYDPRLSSRHVRPARRRPPELLGDPTWASAQTPVTGLCLRRLCLLGLLLRHVALFACSWSAGSIPATGTSTGRQSHEMDHEKGNGRWSIENAVSADEIKVDRAKMHISDTEVAIDIVGMHKWYGDFHVLKDINLRVMRGERIVICGPSGSGKSTMIRCINRLEEHQKGKIIVDGKELTNDLKKIDEVRREVGMVFQHFNLFPHLTILENCTLAPIWVRKIPKKQAEETAMHFLRARQDSRSRRTNILANCPAASSSGSRSRGRCA